MNERGLLMNCNLPELTWLIPSWRPDRPAGRIRLALWSRPFKGRQRPAMIGNSADDGKPGQVTAEALRIVNLRDQTTIRQSGFIAPAIRDSAASRLRLFASG